MYPESMDASGTEKTHKGVRKTWVCSHLFPVEFTAKVSQRDLQCPVLQGILQTGDKEIAVTNLSSEGRVLDRFHHLFTLLIVD